jgi:hypothetical protein
MRHRRLGSWSLAGIGAALAFFALVSSSWVAEAQFVQRGSRLVGSGAVGAARQGYSVSVSADGNTAIVGGKGDNNGVGAAWVFSRSNGLWIQQGGKLVGAGAIGASGQGWAVALSGDGNTALLGAPGDDTDTGAVWVFTRNSGVWTQQAKLLVAGGNRGAQLGGKVSISYDGGTALAGGAGDNGSAGAAWVFTRSGGAWVQQGGKLFGAGANGSASQGQAVALSGDGDTAIVGGSFDANGFGAAWIFTRSNGLWSQQGGKLVGQGAVGQAMQGNSVSLSEDGSTAAIGGPHDNAYRGATWIFSRSNGVWSQQGNKLVANAPVGAGLQGTSVSLSADGDMLLEGAPADNGLVSPVGAWVFTREGTNWSQQGGQLIPAGTTRVESAAGFSVALSSDRTTAVIGGFVDNSNVGAAWIFSPLVERLISGVINSDGSIRSAGTHGFTVEKLNPGQFRIRFTPAFSRTSPSGGIWQG